MDKKILITYCNSWGYRDRAASLADRIKNELGIQNIELTDGRPGIFLVEVDGKEVFHNKKELVKYPDEMDVIERIKKMDWNSIKNEDLLCWCKRSSFE